MNTTKDRWSALSMQQRADLIKLYIDNGITNIGDIRKHYNSFGDGGNTINITDASEAGQTPNNKPVSTVKQTTRKVKSAIMDVLQRYQYDSFIESVKDTLYDLKLGTGSRKDYKNNKYEDVAQDSFLFSRKEQKDAFLNSGYIEGTPGDYGLVTKAVGNRDLPVYQSGKDDITRDKLTVIGNLSDMFFGEGELVHAGHFPTALYKDVEGNVYQKAWDLQDYGADSTGSGGFYSAYNTVKQLGSRVLDKLGNPVVRTTGFRKISDDMLYSLMSQVKDSKLWSELINTKASNIGNDVMENRILTAYDDYLFMKAQELAEKENREFSMEDYNNMKSSVPLDIFKANITKYYDPRSLDEVYGIFINQNKFATGGPFNLNLPVSLSTDFNPVEVPSNYVEVNNNFNTGNKYLTNSNYLEEHSKFRRAFEEFYPKAYYDQKGKTYTIGTGLTYLLDDKGREIKVKKGDKITEQENIKQLKLREQAAEDYARNKTPYWDNYHPELKFQILDAMFNAGNSNVWNKSPKYQKALRQYEKDKGWENPDYNLFDIFQHADWNLNDKKWLGVRARMRRNPQSINPEDYELIYDNQYRDSLYNAYNKKYKKDLK